DDLDALPGAAAVGVVVLGGVRGALATHEVLDTDRLVVALEGSLLEVGTATSPLDGALGSIAAAGDPVAELDLHRGLGVAVAARQAVVDEGADNIAVDDPLELLGGPAD